MRRKRLRKAMMLLGMAAVAAAPAYAFEHLTLRNGQTQDCLRHEAVGDHVRIYTSAENYFEIKAADLVSVDVLPDPVAAATAAAPPLTRSDLGEMLAAAGHQHNIDADLLASIVKAESNGQTKAVSHAGAQGLMQLMPGTAREMGVSDSFEPQQNINGGTQYFDGLLTRYHDNIALAVAAYNAGPAAVDRYHGIPPYRETRVYVARVINEFNHRKKMQLVANKSTEIASK
jgi:soluble lytic murein transglycosylase-like protein